VTSSVYEVDESQAGQLLTALRHWLPGTSWSAARALVRKRRIAINGVVCLDEARVLAQGETVSVAEHPLPAPPSDDDVRILFVDSHVVVVEKPSGMLTLRRKSEQRWSWERRNLQPTLDEVVPRLIAQNAARRAGTKTRMRRLPRIYSVHRIDRDTSGLVMFARTKEAQENFIDQFAARKTLRRYLAIIPGRIDNQTIETRMTRDRGDGVRGNSQNGRGPLAITHVRQLRRLGDYSEVECRLETGRTNQIRIHLAELGHPVCGDIKYRGPINAPVDDNSRCRRLALHATELRFIHPDTNKEGVFESPWPDGMLKYIDRLLR